MKIKQRLMKMKEDKIVNYQVARYKIMGKELLQAEVK